VVQNRVFAKKGWGQSVRAVCVKHGILYQGFSILTANRHVMKDAYTVALAERTGMTTAQVLLQFALQLGMVVLSGAKDPAHMQDDLALLSGDFPPLSPDDVHTLMDIGMSGFDGSTAVLATFVNRFPGQIQIYWVNPEQSLGKHVCVWCHMLLKKGQ
jgi:diketogulonate reductase-like aldo/keto reductase